MFVHRALFIFTLLLGGCSALPSVQYRIIESSKDMDGMTDSFYLRRSEIELTLVTSTTAKDPKNNPALSTEIAIVSKPREYRGTKLGIRADSSWRASTMVALNKTPNTDMINSIGIEVTDNTAKAIGDYGGAIVKVISLLALGAGPALPCLTQKGGPRTIILPDNLPDTMSFDGSGDADVKKGCISIKLSPLPADALKASSIPLNNNTHNFYYSACRDAEITIKQSTGLSVTKTVRINDPMWVQAIQFPPKGTITSHSECGVSVKTENSAPDNGAAIINALATQAKAIKDALDAAKK